MQSGSSLSRRSGLLIALICPVLLGSQVKCVFVSNPTVATARIEQIEPDTPEVGEIVQARGTGNGTPPLQFAWDFGDGTAAAGMQAAHAYLAPGSYRIALTVRDANGNVGRDASQVVVSPRIPSMLTLVAISSAAAGEPVLFAALPLDEDPDALSYVWKFSDGQSAVGPLAAATFPAAGLYLALLTVTNDRGVVVVSQIPFQVLHPAQ